ncbi:MAG: hypothetical protein ACKN9Y_06905 [Bacteroidota bacterium]
MKSLSNVKLLFIVGSLVYYTCVSPSLTCKPISKGKEKKITMKLWGTSYNYNFGKKMYSYGDSDPNNVNNGFNTYFYETTCFGVERYEIYGNVKDVTISIECGKDRKRVYFRKNQNIKGVFKIPDSEVETVECSYENEDGSPYYYFLITDKEGNELFRGEFSASECEG